MSNLSELRTLLRNEIKKDPNGKIWSDSELNIFINQSYRKIQKDGNYGWRENQANTTFSTVVGTQEYSLPTDLGKIQLVRYNGDNLYKTEKVNLKRQYSNFVSGTPSKYYIFGDNLGFDVLPSSIGTIDLDYLKRLSKLTNDTDELAFSEDFDIALIKYASFLAWSTIAEKQNISSVKLQEYQLEIDTLISTFLFDDVNDLTYGKSFYRGITRADVLDR